MYECLSWSSQFAGFEFQMLIWRDIGLKIEYKDQQAGLLGVAPGIPQQATKSIYSQFRVHILF